MSKEVLIGRHIHPAVALEFAHGLREAEQHLRRMRAVSTYLAHTHLLPRVNLETAVCGTNDNFNTPVQDLHGETEDAANRFAHGACVREPDPPRKMLTGTPFYFRVVGHIGGHSGEQ